MEIFKVNDISCFIVQNEEELKDFAGEYKTFIFIPYQESFPITLQESPGRGWEVK